MVICHPNFGCLLELLFIPIKILCCLYFLIFQKDILVIAQQKFILYIITFFCPVPIDKNSKGKFGCIKFNSEIIGLPLCLSF